MHFTFRHGKQLDCFSWMYVQQVEQICNEHYKKVKYKCADTFALTDNKTPIRIQFRKTCSTCGSVASNYASQNSYIAPLPYTWSPDTASSYSLWNMKITLYIASERPLLILTIEFHVRENVVMVTKLWKPYKMPLT